MAAEHENLLSLLQRLGVNESYGGLPERIARTFNVRKRSNALTRKDSLARRDMLAVIQERSPAQDPRGS